MRLIEKAIKIGFIDDTVELAFRGPFMTGNDTNGIEIGFYTRIVDNGTFEDDPTKNLIFVGVPVEGIDIFMNQIDRLYALLPQLKDLLNYKFKFEIRNENDASEQLLPCWLEITDTREPDDAISIYIFSDIYSIVKQDGESWEDFVERRSMYRSEYRIPEGITVMLDKDYEWIDDQNNQIIWFSLYMSKD